MAIELTPDVRDDALASLKQYSEQHLDEPLGNLAAEALLDFFLEEIGPCIYNQAIADVQARLQARVMELDVELHEEPFLYWRRRAKR